jgi:hypothetical protein
MLYIRDTIVPAVGGFVFMVLFCAGLSFVVALTTWKLVLHSKPIRWAGGLLIFVLSASSACGFYGHAAGPVIYLFTVLEEREGKQSAISWAVLVGIVVTGLLLWRSRSGKYRAASETGGA